MQAQQSSQRQNIIQQQIFTPNYPYSIDLQFENPYDDLHPIMNSSSLLRYNNRYKSNISKKSNISNSSRGQLIKIQRIQKHQSKQHLNIHNSSHIHNMNKIAQQISHIQLKKRQCRICLQDESEGRLIRPCLCTGSMQYTHQFCLCEWIKRKSDLKSKNKVKCQVCNYQFQYKITRKLYLSWEQLIGNYEKYKSTYRCFIIALIVSILIWIGLITVTVLGLAGDQKSWINQNIFATDTSEIILICVIVVYFVVIVLAVLLFIAQYGIKSQNVVQNLLNFTKRKENQHPKLIKTTTTRIFDYRTVYNLFNEDNIAIRSQSRTILANQIKFQFTNKQFPIIYDKQIQFELYCNQEFRYNIQQLSNILKGSIKILKNTSSCSSLVYNSENNPISGLKLFSYFRVTSTIPQKASKIMLKDQKIIFRSLVGKFHQYSAYLTQIRKKKIYINIKIGDQNKQTAMVKSHGGEIVYKQLYQMEKGQNDHLVQFDMFGIQAKNNQTKLICTGKLDLQENNNQRKVELKNSKNQVLGQLFIEYHRVKKNNKSRLTRYQNKQKSSTIFTTQSKNYSTIDMAKLQKFRYSPYDNSESFISNRQNKHSNSEYLSVNTNNNNNNININNINNTPTPNNNYINPSSSNPNYQSLLSLSKISSLSRIKRVTVVQNNNEIFFPQQKRFLQYKDKPSPIVSYLESKNGLEFKEKHSGRFYRGASLGYGNKEDFIRKGSPGVGQYKLPSIWDRY